MGAPGLEPGTCRLRGECYYRLSYTPKIGGGGGIRTRTEKNLTGLKVQGRNQFGVTSIKHTQIFNDLTCTNLDRLGNKKGSYLEPLFLHSERSSFLDFDSDVNKGAHII